MLAGLSLYTNWVMCRIELPVSFWKGSDNSLRDCVIESAVFPRKLMLSSVNMISKLSQGAW